jgi:DNA invertase Pin-like site-specific DNA recombinase
VVGAPAGGVTHNRFSILATKWFNAIVLSVLAAVAKQERITISEHTKAGLVRARRAGKKVGRPVIAVDLTKVEKLQREGLGPRAIAHRMGVCVNSIQRARGKIRLK